MNKNTNRKKIYLENDYYIKPSFYDLDPMGVVWHGNYIKFMEQAREAMHDCQRCYVAYSKTGNKIY